MKCVQACWLIKLGIHSKIHHSSHKKPQASILMALHNSLALHPHIFAVFIQRTVFTIVAVAFSRENPSNIFQKDMLILGMDMLHPLVRRVCNILSRQIKIIHA